ncbi:MAG: DNA topoisomerase I [Parcubacteria group bacterium Gr01-1014_30]|nr:MAG: DNA topoisomerase I [Parcubacteria group bacterium Gr01-1014_30]
MQLVLVESPTKSKTISRYVGPKYKVLSSYGHIRDLPENELGVDLQKNFNPKYVVIPKAKKNVDVLKKEAKKASLVILATDEDREGEAIAFHLAYLLDLNGKNPYQRIVFHEITKQAIEEALKNPRKLDQKLVDAQQARRILDRIVGYKLSPFLWKKVARGLSAGRVQSVAVRLVVEREREIEKFVPQEYWSIEALLKKGGGEFSASLVKKDEKIIPKLGVKNKEEADKILRDLEGAEYKVQSVDKKEVRRNPLPPFTTSTLQQTAWNRFGWPAKLTMSLAQQLYEKGWTTYHRTDSLNLSSLALGTAKKFIVSTFGENYHQFRQYKTKSKGAQEAHEALRPTYAENTPDKISAKLEQNQLKLYDLIWRRFLASQMAQAGFDSTAVEIEAGNPKSEIRNPKQIQNSKSQIPKYTFKATGQVLRFDGFLKVYPIKYEETELPPLQINELLKLIKLIPSQHFTQPPPRYTEATLIRALETEGIARPSTYAPILSTVQERNYIEKDEQKRFRPTEIGTVVNGILVNHFPEVVDIKFTALLEENLDKIALGEMKWVNVIREFYDPFAENLQKKYDEVSKKEFTEEPTDKTCPKCGSPLLIRLGKFGKFYACSTFPKCKYTESLKENSLNVACPKCGKGQITEKRTKKGKIFYGCNRFPKCDFALWDKPTGEKCGKCGSLLVETKRKQIKCSSKECVSNVEK